MPKGYYKDGTPIKSPNGFKKGYIPWNKGKHTGISWNKRKKCPQIHPFPSEETRKQWSIIRKGKNLGEKNHLWKGGRRIHRGYIYIYSPNHPYKTTSNAVMEHRLVMEKYLGRYLKPEEEVHHINGIKNDNRIENLMLFQNITEHQRYENRKRNKYGQFI